MKTLTEYMESTFSGDYTPFAETKPTTVITLAGGVKTDCRMGSYSTRAARRIAKLMRQDGWKVRLSAGELIVETP